MPKVKKEEPEEEFIEEEELGIDNALKSIRKMVQNITREIDVLKENAVEEIAQVRPLRTFIRKRLFKRNILRRYDYDEDY